MKNKKIFIFLIFFILILIIIIIFLNIIKNNYKKEKGELIYKLIESKIKNNTAIIEFEVKVLSGYKIDPIKNIRIIQDNKLSIYPLNGYPKIEMKKGEEKYFSFYFHFPNTEKNILEIISSTRQKKLINLIFPEVSEREKNITIEDNLIKLGEGLSVSNKEKYLLNNYQFVKKQDNLNNYYLIVNMTLENISHNENINLNSKDFYLKNKQNEKIISEKQIIIDKFNQKKEFIVPGDKVLIDIFFIVSNKEKEFFLYFKKHKVFTILKTIEPI